MSACKREGQSEIDVHETNSDFLLYCQVVYEPITS